MRECPINRLGILVVVLRTVDRRQVVETRGQATVLGPELLRFLHRRLEIRQRLAIVALLVSNLSRLRELFPGSGRLRCAGLGSQPDDDSYG